MSFRRGKAVGAATIALALVLLGTGCGGQVSILNPIPAVRVFPEPSSNTTYIPPYSDSNVRAYASFTPETDTDIYENLQLVSLPRHIFSRVHSVYSTVQFVMDLARNRSPSEQALLNRILDNFILFTRKEGMSAGFGQVTITSFLLDSLSNEITRLNSHLNDRGSESQVVSLLGFLAQVSQAVAEAQIGSINATLPALSSAPGFTGFLSGLHARLLNTRAQASRIVDLTSSQPASPQVPQGASLANLTAAVSFAVTSFSANVHSVEDHIPTARFISATEMDTVSASFITRIAETIDNVASAIENLSSPSRPPVTTAAPTSNTQAGGSADPARMARWRGRDYAIAAVRSVGALTSVISSVAGFIDKDMSEKFSRIGQAAGKALEATAIIMDTLVQRAPGALLSSFVNVFSMASSILSVFGQKDAYQTSLAQLSRQITRLEQRMDNNFKDLRDSLDQQTQYLQEIYGSVKSLSALMSEVYQFVREYLPRIQEDIRFVARITEKIDTTVQSLYSVIRTNDFLLFVQPQTDAVSRALDEHTVVWTSGEGKELYSRFRDWPTLVASAPQVAGDPSTPSSLDLLANVHPSRIHLQLNEFFATARREFGAPQVTAKIPNGPFLADGVYALSAFLSLKDAFSLDEDIFSANDFCNVDRRTLQRLNARNLVREELASILASGNTYVDAIGQMQGAQALWNGLTSLILQDQQDLVNHFRNLIGVPSALPTLRSMIQEVVDGIKNVRSLFEDYFDRRPAPNTKRRGPADALQDFERYKRFRFAHYSYLNNQPLCASEWDNSCRAMSLVTSRLAAVGRNASFAEICANKGVESIFYCKPGFTEVCSDGVKIRDACAEFSFVNSSLSDSLNFSNRTTRECLIDTPFCSGWMEAIDLASRSIVGTDVFFGCDMRLLREMQTRLESLQFLPNGRCVQNFNTTLFNSTDQDSNTTLVVSRLTTTVRTILGECAGNVRNASTLTNLQSRLASILTRLTSFVTLYENGGSRVYASDNALTMREMVGSSTSGAGYSTGSVAVKANVVNAEVASLANSALGRIDINSLSSVADKYMVFGGNDTLTSLNTWLKVTANLTERQSNLFSIWNDLLIKESTSNAMLTAHEMHVRALTNYLRLAFGEDADQDDALRFSLTEVSSLRSNLVLAALFNATQPRLFTDVLQSLRTQTWRLAALLRDRSLVARQVMASSNNAQQVFDGIPMSVRLHANPKRVQTALYVLSSLQNWLFPPNRIKSTRLGPLETYYAFKFNMTDITTRVLQYELDIDEKFKFGSIFRDGSTALGISIQCCDWSTATTLLRNFADPDAVHVGLGATSARDLAKRVVCPEALNVGRVDFISLLRTCLSTEYEAVPPTATSDRLCRKISECKAGQFQVAPATPTSDTVCRNQTVCGSNEYEVLAPTFSTDRICRSVLSCSAGEYVVVDPTNDPASRVCVKLTSCRSPQEFESVAPSNTSDRTCAPVSSCTASQFELKAPTATSDRVCINITRCGQGEYEAIPPSRTQDAFCVPLRNCTLGEYEAVPATYSSDRICRSYAVCGPEQVEIQVAPPALIACVPRRVCKSGSEFEVSAGSKQEDRVCAPISDCPDGKIESKAPTATSDRVCGDPVVDTSKSSKSSSLSSMLPIIIAAAGGFLLFIIIILIVFAVRRRRSTRRYMPRGQQHGVMLGSPNDSVLEVFVPPLFASSAPKAAAGVDESRACGSSDAKEMAAAAVGGQGVQPRYALVVGQAASLSFSNPTYDSHAAAAQSLEEDNLHFPIQATNPNFYYPVSEHNYDIIDELTSSSTA